MLHIIQTLYHYLGMNQSEFAQETGVSTAELYAMENKAPCGQIAKYQKVSQFLGVPLEALIKNDYCLIPESFFEQHPAPVYRPVPKGADLILGRQGEELILAREQKRLAPLYPALARLVLPYFKMSSVYPGYDILSFDDDGVPFCIEVKTVQSSVDMFKFSTNEVKAAKKLAAKGHRYVMCLIKNWGTEDQIVMDVPFAQIGQTYQLQPTGYHCIPIQPKVAQNGIAYFRQLRGLRQQDLAGMTNCSRCAVSQFETGAREPTIAFLLEASKVLGATVDELMAEYPDTDEGFAEPLEAAI